MSENQGEQIVTNKTKPLDKRCRFVIESVAADEVTGEENRYTLKPIGRFPGRDLKVGDIFQPVGFDPKEAE